MRKVLAVALPLGLALLAGVLLSSSFRARDEAAEARSERARLKREFDERVALLRALPAEAAREWRAEVNVLLRGYLDGLSVPEVAQHLDRTVHATEALLVRARNAFRVAYARGECDDD